MKKNLKKILILLILFVLAVAGYFTWSWMQLREDGAVYTSIEDANLPVAYVNILGRRMNELDGFVEDSQKAAGRGDLTLLPADRKLSVTIDKLDSQITGMQYEIRSLDGERLVERTTLDHWEQSGEEVSAELPIQNLLTEESEYRLTIAIATEKHPAIYFYTRVMWQQESRVQEMVDLAVSFSEKTFDYDSARELTTYLETDPNADNSSLGHVTLKSDFSQLTWKGLSMERVSEPEIHLRELQGIIGTIDLKYVVSEMKDGKAAAYYDVIESFTMKLGAQRIYIMTAARTRFLRGRAAPILATGFSWGFRMRRICSRCRMKRGNTVPLWQTGRSGFMIQEKKRAQRYLRSARARMIRGSIMIPTESRFWM